MSAAKKLKDLYETDGHEWYLKNAQLIREGKLSEIDMENVAEELESMGKSEQDKLESFLTQLFLHILKWKCQPERRGSSWEASIRKQRKNVKKHLLKNPSLKGCLESIVKDAYDSSRDEAVEETNLPFSLFPEEMPFTLEEALTDDWLP